MSRTRGVTDAEIGAIGDWRGCGTFNEAERAALEFAEEMCRTPVDVSDEVFARLRAHFDENQVVELAATIAWENYRARFNRSLRIGSDGLYACPVTEA